LPKDTEKNYEKPRRKLPIHLSSEAPGAHTQKHTH